jgi:hypothetical protein
MFEKIRVVFTIPELRKKILLTVLLLGIYRLGVTIPLPIINQQALAPIDEDSGTGLGRMIEYAAVFSAANLRQITIFGLGIMPYISARLSSSYWAASGNRWRICKKREKPGARRSMSTPGTPPSCSASSKAGCTYACS